MAIPSVTSFPGVQSSNIQANTAQLNAPTQAAQNPGSPAHEAKETPAEEAREKQAKAPKIGNIVNILA